jgi:hypothetical protein
MKKSLTILSQIIIVLIGIGTLAFMLWEPHLEGRNVNATFFEIYFNDPFLAYAYLASILFFVSLYQIFKVLGYVRENKAFSQEILKALRTIKYCMMFLIGFIIAAEVYIFIAVRGKDDIAGGVAMGLFLIFISVLITTAAAMYERSLQNTIDKNPKTT